MNKIIVSAAVAVAGHFAPFHLRADPVSDLSRLPVLTARDAAPAGVDYLVRPIDRRAGVYRSRDGRDVILTNGLIRRVWRIAPNAACIALDNLMTGQSILRAVQPEATVTIDGVAYNVGGLIGQPDHAYLLPAWLGSMTADPAAFHVVGITVGAPVARLAWKRVRHAAPGAAWPPPGIALRFDFAPPAGPPVEQRKPATEPGVGAASKGLDAAIRVSVHYELYDGIPVISKWISVRNGGPRSIDVDRFAAEVLSVVEHGNTVESREGVALLPPDVLHVETDYAFGGFTQRNASRFSVHWRPDPQYRSQVNYKRENPCLLVVAPQVGPDQTVPSGETFTSFHVFELIHDATDRERRGLALRRMIRTVAPWVTENPLILHVVSTDPDVVRRAIDQAAACGFEMVSLSFGSGLNMEDVSEANVAKFRRLAKYAAGKGIELGGYSLLASRHIRPDRDNCINPKTGKPGGQTFGFCPALASDWGQAYFRELRQFFSETGFLQFTHDGSYPGDLDAASRPPLQKGVTDSRWVQWRIITNFYQWLRARGVYLRVPDYYFLSGSNECGMGYREVNWSLPRAQQVIHTRQNIYDGTWEKAPSMGWMFVPLTQYHGGGAAATIEPLDAHLDHYRRMLTSNLGLGVQAVYRGHRLYDTERVRAMVTRQVEWYRRHRDILESDLIHGRRADGRAIDWMLHVNPYLPEKGLLVVFNPRPRAVRRTLRVKLYYTGLTDVAHVHQDGPARVYQLDRDYTIDLPVDVPAGGMRWYVIQ